MNKEAKLFLLFIVFITLLVVVYRYNEYIIHKNFVLNVNTSCNSTSENCFVSDCLPGEDPECDTTPYKKVEILDSIAPLCLEEHTCPQFFCKNDRDCVITYCSENTIGEGEKCSELLIQK